MSRYLRSGHADGALFVSMHGRPDFDYESLGIPLVLCGRPVTDASTLSYVDADNIGGASAAVRYPLDSGRKAVATIAGPPDMAAGIDRLLGYRTGLTIGTAYTYDVVAVDSHGTRRCRLPRSRSPCRRRPALAALSITRWSPGAP